MVLKNFTAPETAPILVGGIGDGGPMDDFYATWRMKKVIKGCWIVGKRKDDGKGCFSIQSLGSGNWDIAFYADCKVTEIWDSIKNKKILHAANASYTESDPINKYLALDLIKILKQQKELEDTLKERG